MHDATFAMVLVDYALHVDDGECDACCGKCCGELDDSLERTLPGWNQKVRDGCVRRAHKVSPHGVLGGSVRNPFASMYTGVQLN